MPVHLLFGRTRQARRRGVSALLRGRRDAAYVMGTWRKREQLVRELGVTPTGAVHLREPEAWVFAHLCDELARRFVDDRAPWTPGEAAAAGLSIARSLRDDTLTDDVATARALVDAAEAWACAGRAPDDPAQRRWIGAATLALDANPRRRRRSQRLRLLRDALQAPSPALRTWLGRHPAVVIDDLCGSSPLEASVVTALCAAWSDAGAEVVLSFAVGRDRGGREVAAALGVDADPDREAAAFSATYALRSAALEDLVASGLAECWVWGPLGLRGVDPAFDDGPDGALDLADAVATGTPLPAMLPAGGLSVGSFPDVDAEASFVAASLAALLADGLDPRDALVAVADLGLEPALARALDDAGVPWARGGGRPLGPVPAVRTASALLALSLDGRPPDEVAAVAVFAGAEPALGERLRARGADPEALRPTLDALPSTEPATGAEWGVRLRAAWAALSAPDVVAAQIDEALAQVAADLVVVDAGPWDATAVRALVDHALGELVAPEVDTGFAAVPVVGVREILGLTPRHVFVVGLRAGSWATSPPRGPLAPGPGVGRDHVAEARYLLHSLLRDAVGEPWMRGVHLSWPASVQGRPQRPAPLLAELLDLPVGGGRLRDHLPHPEASAVGTHTGDLRARARAGVEPAARVAAERRGPAGRRDGVLTAPIDPFASMSVTALETYLRCPHRYWVRHTLGVEALEVDDPELEPRRRGTAIHRILEEFLRARGLRPPSQDADPVPARRALFEVAGRVLDEVEAEGGFDPLFHGWARRRWLAGLVDDEPAGLLRSWLDHERERAGAWPIAVERRFDDLAVGPVTLKGTIDRVDAQGGARLVIDYKTGRPPTREEVSSGLSLQPFAYLATVEGPAAACFQVLSRPDRLARTGFVGDRAALDAVCSPAERGPAREVDTTERADVLAAAGRAAEALLAGVFPPSPHEPALAGCPSCPYRSACRRDLRHAEP